MAHAHEGHHEHGHHHDEHDGDFHPRKISFSTLHAILLKNTPPARHGAVQLGEDHTTPRMAQALAYYRKDMQDIVALSASPDLPWGTPWAGTTVGAILGLTYGLGTSLNLHLHSFLLVKSMTTGASYRGLRAPPMKSLGVRLSAPRRYPHTFVEGRSFWFDL